MCLRERCNRTVLTGERSGTNGKSGRKVNTDIDVWSGYRYHKIYLLGQVSILVRGSVTKGGEMFLSQRILSWAMSLYCNRGIGPKYCFYTRMYPLHFISVTDTIITLRLLVAGIDQIMIRCTHC